MKHWRLFLVPLFLCVSVCAQGPQVAPADDASHQALREMRAAEDAQS